MKPAILSFLIVGLGASFGYSQCSYFRVSTKFLQCSAADTKALDALDPYRAVQDAPELEDPTVRNLVQVRCECEYSLQGSDQRCDMDQTVEKSAVLDASDPDHSCRRENLLCKDVCPPIVP
jgi:hypothetical protein